MALNPEAWKTSFCVFVPMEEKMTDLIDELPSYDAKELPGLEGLGDQLARHQAVLLRSAVHAPEVEAISRQMGKLFQMPAPVLKPYLRPERYDEGIAGYTPPSRERVRGYAPDSSRHFWDVDGGGILPPGPSFSLCVRSFHGRLVDLAHVCLRALDRSLGTPFAEIARGGPHLLRINQYLNEETSDEVVFPTHRDPGIGTLAIGGASAGFQVQRAGEELRDLLVPPGAAVFFPGMLAKRYAPKISALPHRVRATSLNRISLVFFTEPRNDVVLPSGDRADVRQRRLLGQIRVGSL